MTGREAALTALRRCRTDGAWSSETLDRLFQSEELAPREAALASRLTLGVLQNSGWLDFLIGQYAKGRLQNEVRELLRLGTYQILCLDRVPDRAAVSETVELCRSLGYERAAGLVNAVLRRIAENKDRLPEPPGRGTADYLSVRYSHPLWLAERLTEQRGYDFTEAFFAENNREPPLSLHVNTQRTELSGLLRQMEAAGLPCELAPSPRDFLLLPGGRVKALPGYAEGLFFIQDRAAGAAVEIAAPKPGMRVLDACAAPGGKSFAAALWMRDEGSILSCDLHEKKLRLIEEGAERLGLRCIHTAARDARRLPAEEEGLYDLVLADVPCSGLGVIRKKPEIRRKSAGELAALPEKQLEILRSLKKAVKPGGTLLYSTCTVLREENEDVVERFLSESPDYSFEDFTVLGRSSVRGCLCFWPQLDGTDGFFAAKLIREAT